MPAWIVSWASGRGKGAGATPSVRSGESATDGARRSSPCNHTLGRPHGRTTRQRSGWNLRFRLMLPLLVELAFILVLQPVEPSPPKRLDPPGCHRETRSVAAIHPRICVYTDRTIDLCQETMAEVVLVCPGKPPEQIAIDVPAMRGRFAKKADTTLICKAHPEAKGCP